MKFYLLFLIAVFSIHEIKAQVTIGSNIPSKEGALLDLKENGNNAVNSARGLMLPRVNLTDMSNLYPMFESTSVPGTPNGEYNTPEKKSNQDAIHTGLLVYNLNSCKGFSPGAYSWLGDKWKLLGPDKSTKLPTVSVSFSGSPCIKTEWDESTSTLLVHIPSGADLRTLTNPIQMKVDWTPATVNLIKHKPMTDSDAADLPDRTLSDTGDDRYARGGVVFENGTSPVGWTDLSGGAGIYTFDVKPMNDLSIGTDPGQTPWRSRQTTLEFSVTEDVCNETIPMKIVINQTNYRLKINEGDDDKPLRETRRYKDGKLSYRLLLTPTIENAHSGYGVPVPVTEKDNTGWDGNYFKIGTESNAMWQVHIDKYDSDIISDFRVPSDVPFPNLNWGAGELRLGQNPVYHDVAPVKTGVTMPDYPYYVGGNYSQMYKVTDIPDRQYRKAALLTFKDYSDCTRYPDVTVEAIQCSATFDKTDIKDGNITDPASWGQDVLSHTDQQGNVFYSAGFGEAGRWMITNLAATEYADHTPLVDPNDSGKGSLQLIANNTLNFFDLTLGPRFAYPLAGNLTVNFTVGDKPADTDTQGYSNYFKKWYPEHGVLYNWFAAVRQQSGDSNSINRGQTTPLDSPPGIGEVESTETNGYIQGICPDGWHLPSDREWNRLERYIYNKIRNGDLSQTQYDADDLSKIQNDPLPLWDSSWETSTDSALRGYNVDEGEGSIGHIGHGGAMKSVCPPINMLHAYLNTTKGYSAEPKLGGFNAIPIGRMTLKGSDDPDMGGNPNQYVSDNEQGALTLEEYVDAYVNEDPKHKETDWNLVIRDYSYDAAFWSSSATGGRTSWARQFPRGEAKVNREVYYTTYLVSVRCVKNP